MIVDTSAVIAILKREDDAARYERAITDAAVEGTARMSVASWVEATLVARRVGEDYVRALDLLIEKIGIELVAVSVEQAGTARRAHRRYGKGSGSPAKLNYGDCFSYALAATEQDTLLFKGDDFGHTDILPAL